MLRAKDLCNCEQALLYKQALKEIQDFLCTRQEESDAPYVLDIIEEALKIVEENEYEF